MSGHVRMPKLRRAGGLKPLLPKDVSKWMKVVQVESAVNSPWSRNGCGWIFIDWDNFHWVFLWCTTGKMKLMAFLSSDSFVPTFLLSTLEFQFGLELGGKQRKLLVFDQVLWKQRWNPQKKAWACCVSPCLSLSIAPAPSLSPTSVWEATLIVICWNYTMGFNLQCLRSVRQVTTMFAEGSLLVPNAKFTHYSKEKSKWPTPNHSLPTSNYRLSR